jgi:hypothetical protein
MRVKLRVPIAFLLLAASAAARPPDPDSRVTHYSIAAGFRIVSIAESDGGRLVRMRGSGRGYSFEYSLEFWRGNGGVVGGSVFRSGECRSGEAGSIQPTGEAMARQTLDLRLADYLRECPLTPALEAELRRRLDSAWPIFSAHADLALAATIAENEAIARGGEQD